MLTNRVRNMEIIFILIPLSLVLVLVALGGFFWAVKSGQFDDLESPAIDMLHDDDSRSNMSGLNDKNVCPAEGDLKG